MAVLTSYNGSDDAYLEIGTGGSGQIRRGGMGFQIASGADCNGAILRLKNVSGAAGDNMTVRIETDNAGVPSGTLVNANATGSILFSALTSSYQDLPVTFAGSFALSSGTTYWLVIQLTTEGGGEKIIGWAKDTTSPGYATYNAAQYNNSWSAEAGSDASFSVTGPDVISMSTWHRGNIPIQDRSRGIIM